MPVDVRLPTLLRANTDGASSVAADGFVNVYVNDDDIRYLEQLDTKVSDGDVISILPAVAGG